VLTLAHTEPKTIAPSIDKTVTAGVRLHFLDGLRGVCALYVLLFHEASSTEALAGEFSAPSQFLRTCLNYGHVSVVVFIVISGFSLTFPVARSGGFHVIGGFGEYVRRRARRILPPYYAALAASALLILIFNRVVAGPGQAIQGALSVGSLLSHVFLVHNLSSEWVYRLNAPMWSVATEWQIYFLFVLLLLPALRRVGLFGLVLFAWLLGCLPALLMTKETDFWWACPWFLGSFALGMTGAFLGYGKDYQTSRLHGLPWAKLSLFFVVASAVIGSDPFRFIPLPVRDIAPSLGAFCIVNACVAQSQGRAEPSNLLRFLSHPKLVSLGGFSYSLYLVHHPFVSLASRLLKRLGIGPEIGMYLQLFLLTPIVLAVAWVFSGLFETRTFWTRKPQPSQAAAR
jgi:peptidoglycan/LPS O-acetylase OafA/YrhL